MDQSALSQFTQFFTLADSAATERVRERLALVLHDPGAYQAQFAEELAERGIETALPPLVTAIRESGHPVAWICDPCHGNTFTAPSGPKTRDWDNVLTEVEHFFAIHRSLGTWPGGLHLELTGDNVTECLGGSDKVLDQHLAENYTTICDPRLNARQSLDLAFRAAELLHPV